MWTARADVSTSGQGVLVLSPKRTPVAKRLNASPPGFARKRMAVRMTPQCAALASHGTSPVTSLTLRLCFLETHVALRRSTELPHASHNKRPAGTVLAPVRLPGGPERPSAAHAKQSRDRPRWLLPARRLPFEKASFSGPHTSTHGRESCIARLNVARDPTITRGFSEEFSHVVWAGQPDRQLGSFFSHVKPTHEAKRVQYEQRLGLPLARRESA